MTNIQLRSEGFIARLSQNSLNQNEELSFFQRSIDQSIEGFSHQLTEVQSLLPLLAGGISYRLFRSGALSLMGTHLPARLVAPVIGLASEVTVVEGIGRGIRGEPFISRCHENSSSLEPTLVRSWFHSFFSFGLFKISGQAMAGQNLLIQHLMQDSAMVAGNYATAALGLHAAPMGSWIEQALHAEMSNVQLGLSMSLARLLTPVFSIYESSLDRVFHRSSLASQEAFPVLNETTFSSPSSSFKETLRHIALAPMWMMMGTGGIGGGGRPPRSTSSSNGPSSSDIVTPPMQIHVPSPEVPGPRRWSPHFATLQYMLDPVRFALTLPRGEEGVTGVCKGSGGMVVVYGERLAQELLTENDTWIRPRGGLVTPPLSHPHVGNLLDVLLFSNGEAWRTRRRILTPPTHRSDVLSTMAPAFQKTVEEIGGRWQPGTSIDIRGEGMRIALRNMLRGLLGVEPEMGEPISNLMHHFTSGVTNPLVGFFQGLGRGRVIPKTPYASWIQSGERLRAALNPLIEYKRQHPANDALGALVASTDAETGLVLSNDAVIGELTSFYGAGYESTARTLTWTLWLLAHHPQIAERAAQEVADVLQGRAPTWEHIKALSYLEDVISESQRLITVVPSTIPRTPIREGRLGGVLLAPGSNLTLSTFLHHHNPKVFPQPGSFRPERWAVLRDSGTKLTYHFLPFGAGPRRCIGGVFAAFQLKSTLALLLQRYSFIPHETPVDYNIAAFVTSPKNPLPLRVEAPGSWRETPAPRGTITRFLRNPDEITVLE
ncbi:MAG: cytochrome P450 [Deltaproteobacteria bacterium]|nr:cytochrome P450 [Deltaproteobacteria bacterium]